MVLKSTCRGSSSYKCSFIPANQSVREPRVEGQETLTSCTAKSNSATTGRVPWALEERLSSAQVNCEAQINPHVLFIVMYQKEKQNKQTKKNSLVHLHIYARIKKIEQAFSL